MIHLLPRAGGKPISIPLPGGRTHFHLWNAYEADGKVIADAIGYPGAVRFASLVPESVRRSSGAALETTPPTATWRYTLDPAGRSVRDEKLTDLCAEAPEIRADRRGRPYRFRWAPSAGTPGDEVDHGAFNWFHALARRDFEERSTQLWDAGPRAYVSAAAFASRAGASAEDDGYVLAFIQDTAANATTVGILDARDIASGPIARLSGAGLLGAITHVAFA